MIKTALLTLSIVTTPLMADDWFFKCHFSGIYFSDQKKIINFPLDVHAGVLGHLRRSYVDS